MASNDAEPELNPVVAPNSGPVAFLTRVVRLPSVNEQTPLRVICVVVLALTLAATPFPWNAVGFASLVVLALSLGRITPVK